jgi:protein-S-isoprenylcysteine O-methyltransferase Ste14
VIALVAMFALHFPIPLFMRRIRLIPWPWSLLGALPLLAGIVLNLWADGLFKRHETEVKPFRESRALVTEGPFRFSRHPMYLGGMLMLSGVALLLGSLLPFLILPVAFWVVSVVFIVQEERDMIRQFGDRYRQYSRRVRRWI